MELRYLALCQHLTQLSFHLQKYLGSSCDMGCLYEERQSEHHINIESVRSFDVPNTLFVHKFRISTIQDKYQCRKPRAILPVFKMRPQFDDLGRMINLGLPVDIGGDGDAHVFRG